MTARLINASELLKLDGLIQVAVHRQSDTYVGSLDVVEQHPDDIAWRATRGPWDLRDGRMVGTLGGAAAAIVADLPLIVRDFAALTPPNVGDIVWARTYQGREVPAQVEKVHTYPGQPEYTTVEAHTIAHGTIWVGVDDVRSVGPVPAPEQRWRCLTTPGLVLTVESVTRGGLLADCRTPKGSLTTVQLFGHYALITDSDEAGQ